MADDPTELEQLRAALAEKDRQVAAAMDRLGRMDETLAALRPKPAGPAALPPGKKFIIPPDLHRQIAALGLSDQEIEQNGALIVPFLNAYLGQAASEVLALLQGQADEITILKMYRDDVKYPHLTDVAEEMVRIRAEESKSGRYMAPDTAYRVALANNYDKLGPGGEEGQFTGPDTRQARQTAPSPVSARSRDASAGSSLRSVKAPTTVPERPARTADDLMQMTREERKSYFEANSNTPIKTGT